MIYKPFFSFFPVHISLLFLLGGWEITCWQRFTHCSQWYSAATLWIPEPQKIFSNKKNISVDFTEICHICSVPDSWAAAFWCGFSSHQGAATPGAPVAEDTVLRAGQPAFPGPQGHLLRVAQVVLDGLRRAVNCVEHAPVGSGKKHPEFDLVLAILLSWCKERNSQTVCFNWTGSWQVHEVPDNLCASHTARCIPQSRWGQVYKKKSSFTFILTFIVSFNKNIFTISKK